MADNLKYSGLFFKYSATEIFMVPKRYFDSQAQFDEFANEFNELRNKNKDP